ncbi:hypothetical protein [Actinokineospora sp.]|uniref:hypothetical protein n=1 Tax=Actinokineospora sp. TaxID=1872133 RepID=UPI003D6B5480
MRITDDAMISDRTRHEAHTVRSGETYGPWTVSWLPERFINRNQAITAMTLAETVAGVLLTTHDVTMWAVIDDWAAELGLTGPDAVGRIAHHGYWGGTR